MYIFGMFVMLAKLVPTITAPRVPPSTMLMAEGERIAMGLEPSMVAPRYRPTIATTRPIADEAFIVRSPRHGGWVDWRRSRRRAWGPLRCGASACSAWLRPGSRSAIAGWRRRRPRLDRR